MISCLEKNDHDSNAKCIDITLYDRCASRKYDYCTYKVYKDSIVRYTEIGKEVGRRGLIGQVPYSNRYRNHWCFLKGVYTFDWCKKYREYLSEIRHQMFIRHARDLMESIVNSGLISRGSEFYLEEDIK